MSRITATGLFALMAFVGAGHTSAHAQCTKLFAQLKEVQRAVQTLEKNRQYHCRRGTPYCSVYTNFVRQMQSRQRQLASAYNQCRNSSGNNGNPSSTNQCDELRRRIRKNASDSRARAYAQLRRRARRGYIIERRLLRTTYCSQSLSYYQPRRQFVRTAYEARRIVDRVTNNLGIVRVTPY